jgi:hypothetical protein
VSDPTPTIPTEPPPAFVGWRRKRGGRWWIACGADTESECFRKLLDVAHKDGPGHADLMVLPNHEQP